VWEVDGGRQFTLGPTVWEVASRGELCGRWKVGENSLRSHCVWEVDSGGGERGGASSLVLVQWGENSPWSS
jgi:hypothetical protein